MKYKSILEKMQRRENGNKKIKEKAENRRKCTSRIMLYGKERRYPRKGNVDSEKQINTKIAK